MDTRYGHNIFVVFKKDLSKKGGYNTMFFNFELLYVNLHIFLVIFSFKALSGKLLSFKI